MLRQDRGLLLAQGHQPFGVSQLWVLGLSVALVWQDVFLQACQPVSEAPPLAVTSVWLLVLRQHHSLFHRPYPKHPGVSHGPRGAPIKDRPAWPHCWPCQCTVLKHRFSVTPQKELLNSFAKSFAKHFAMQLCSE